MKTAESVLAEWASYLTTRTCCLLAHFVPRCFKNTFHLRCGLRDWGSHQSSWRVQHHQHQQKLNRNSRLLFFYPPLKPSWSWRLLCRSSGIVLGVRKKENSLELFCDSEFVEGDKNPNFLFFYIYKSNSVSNLGPRYCCLTLMSRINISKKRKSRQ